MGQARCRGPCREVARSLGQVAEAGVQSVGRAHVGGVGGRCAALEPSGGSQPFPAWHEVQRVLPVMFPIRFQFEVPAARANAGTAVPRAAIWHRCRQRPTVIHSVRGWRDGGRASTVEAAPNDASGCPGASPCSTGPGNSSPPAPPWRRWLAHCCSVPKTLGSGRTHGLTSASPRACWSLPTVPCRRAPW